MLRSDIPSLAEFVTVNGVERSSKHTASPGKEGASRNAAALSPVRPCVTMRKGREYTKMGRGPGYPIHFGYVTIRVYLGRAA